MSEYSDELELLAAPFLESATPARFAPLAKLLGCNYILYGSAHKDVYFPDQPDAANENAARQTLTRLLQRNISQGYLPSIAFGVLGGVVRGGRWRDCMQTIDGGYALALSFIQWVAGLEQVQAQTATKKTEIIRDAMAPDVNLVLNEWLEPRTPWLDFPSRNALVSAFFGPAWCAIMEVDARPTIELLRFINLTRPPFEAGLLPAFEQSTTTLPDLF